MSGEASAHNRIKYDMLSAVTALCLVVAVFLTVMQAVVTGNGKWWFQKEFIKYSVLEDVRGELSMDEAIDVMGKITSYMVDGEGNLDFEYIRNGKSIEFLSEDAKTHLEDCKGIVAALKIVRMVAASVFIILAIWLRRRQSLTKRGFAYAIGILIIVCGLLAIAAGSFDEAFVTFHKILFDNDLWLIDPNVDDLINLLPQGFFSDTLVSVTIVSGLISVIVFCAVARNYKK